jgi:predicted PurR-regulated permease PerM
MNAAPQPSLIQTRNQILFWLGMLALFSGFVWLFKDILLPFVLGMVIAYLLDPAVKTLRRRNVPRWSAAVIILGTFALFIFVLLVLLAPLVVRETAQLIEALPSYADKFNRMADHYSRLLQQRFHSQDIPTIQDALKDNITSAVSAGSGIVLSIATGTRAVLDLLYTAVLTPIIAFLMMNDWPRMKRWLDDMVPRQNHEIVGELWHDIDRKLSGFIRGQLLLAFFLGMMYCVALTLAGLNYGFLIGLCIGVGSLIPLVGSTTGLLTSLAVAWVQTHDLTYVGIIAMIFFTGQFIEGNILTPRLLGRTTGLHPLWVLFSLTAGAALAGIVGMLVAVPAAAMASVVVGYLIRKYKRSAFYAPEGLQADPQAVPQTPAAPQP